FAPVTGAMKKGFAFDSSNNVLRYFDNNGKMISDKIQNDQGTWFVVNSATGEIIARGEVMFGGQVYLFTHNNDGKIVTGFQKKGNARYYYDASLGSKTFGERKIADSWYLFDDTTGAMKVGFQNVPRQNKMSYYDKRGKMVHGELKQNGHWYYFDDITGGMVK